MKIVTLEFDGISRAEEDTKREVSHNSARAHKVAEGAHEDRTSHEHARVIISAYLCTCAALESPRDIQFSGRLFAVVVSL